MEEQKEGTQGKRMAEAEKKQGKEPCWWNGKKCPYNTRGGGLENANLAWCKSCREVDAGHLMKFAVEILGERNVAGGFFLYEGTPDELSRLNCLVWREE